MTDTNKNFKVRHGLTVGEESFTVAADTGNVVTAGDVNINGGELTIASPGYIYSGTGLALQLTGNDVTTSGNLTVTGDLTVNGTTTTINTENLLVEDNIVTLNSNVTGTPATNAGIEIERGDSTNSALIWDETADKWYQNRAGTSTQIAINTDELNEGSTNQYFTTARARTSISATDTGGDGSLSYDNSTGVITYTGPSATEVRAHFSGGTGVTITDGVVAIGQPVAVTDDVIFDQVTATNLVTSAIAPSSGDITVTTANGGNLLVSRNYVKGNIRNATVKAAGDIFALGATSTVLPTRGVSIDNSIDTNKRPGIVLRSYGGGIAGANPRTGIIFESARGTAAAPTAITNGNFLAEFAATGYTGTGWAQELATGVPALINLVATENWAGTSNLGTGFTMLLQPAATTWTGGASLIPVMVVNPQTVITRSDSYSLRTKAGSTTAGEFLSLATSGAIIKNGSNTELANFATGTATISADTVVLQKSNGTDMLSLSSDNSTLTTTRLRQTASGAYGGEISMKAGILNGATGYDKTTELSVTALTLDGSNNATYETKTNRFDGTNYSPTQTNDILGRFTFLGNYGTGTEPLSVNAAGALQVRAAEDFTASASGTRISLSVNKLGTNDGMDVIEASSAQTSIRGDAIVFQDSSLAALPGGKIDYRRTFGCFHKVADVTAAAADTVYAFDWYTDTTAHVGNQGVTVTSGNPTRINIDAAASYDVFMEMQAKNVDNAERTAWIWLAKNGTDLDETRIKVTLRPAVVADTHQLISKAWCVDGIAANDYLEVRFAVDNISGISLEYEAAQTTPFVMPAMPSATITVSPIGA